MAETLGSLCDKLSIVKLKQYHSSDKVRLESLSVQEKQIILEIDEYIQDAISGKTPVSKMTFDANKVYKKDGNDTRELIGNIGNIFSELATINCELWHEQEKVYDFSNIPIEKKDLVVKRLAILNLERNKCVDEINKLLVENLNNRIRNK